MLANLGFKCLKISEKLNMHWQKSSISSLVAVGSPRSPVDLLPLTERARLGTFSARSQPRDVSPAPPNSNFHPALPDLATSASY